MNKIVASSLLYSGKSNIDENNIDGVCVETLEFHFFSSIYLQQISSVLSTQLLSDFILRIKPSLYKRISIYFKHVFAKNYQFYVYGFEW